MFSWFRVLKSVGLYQQFKRWGDVLIIVPGVTAIAVGLHFTGTFQFLEWATLDRFFRVKPLESPDAHIIVVTIGESDLTEAGSWPISDHILAKLLKKIQSQSPSVIGLDLYRNLPVEPGYAGLQQVFQSSPPIIGVEKVVGDAVAPPPTLAELEQVGMADVVLDADGKVRRGLLSTETAEGEIKLGLATTLALHYLEQKQITLMSLDEQMHQLQLGKAQFTPLESNEGGYVKADTGGYQILLNYRGPTEGFQTVSMSDVLKGRIEPDLMRDRIILVGTVAESLKDPFQSPYNGTHATTYTFTPGVIIHANLASQMLNAALEGRPQLRGMNSSYLWVWVGGWSWVTVVLTRLLLSMGRADRAQFSILTVFGITVTSGLLLTSSFIAFLGGYWVPLVPAMVGIGLAFATVGLRQYAQSVRLSSVDSLTQLANRRFFDEYLKQRMLECQPIALLLCDVDHFKLYNDEYGHQAGDRCLVTVATAIRQSVRASDLAARYGGEEFVVVLPNTDATVAIKIAERVRESIEMQEIPHTASLVDNIVTLSGGVAILESTAQISPEFLIEKADQALYQAKHKGRNCVTAVVI